MKMRPFLRKAGMLLFVGVMAYTIYNQEVIIANIHRNIASQQEEYLRVREEHERLQGTMESTRTDEFTIRNARMRLGMVKPGEIPVIDTSSGD